MYSSLVPLLQFTAVTLGTCTAFPWGDFTTCVSALSNADASQAELSSHLHLNL